ncbi:MAG: FAD-dependent oxidoreductase [Myxococcota bacterium]
MKMHPWDKGIGATALDWALRLIAAGILFQTLFFKFTAAPESVYIFSTLGLEPWGRIGSGIGELVASILLLAPQTVVLGAVLAVGIISGAIMSHLTVLGIEVQGDGGLLFGLALVVFASALALIALRRRELPFVGDWFLPRLSAAANAPGSVASQVSCAHLGATDAHVKRVLILGGGFGGVFTALELQRRLGVTDEVEVTLVARDNFFLFTPMLHEVAASDLDLTNVVSPIRKILRRVHFFAGTVEEIDLDARRVRLCHGSDHHVHAVEYDVLVLALGSSTHFFGTPGLEQNAFTMKSLDDAMQLRNHLIACIEEADTECAASTRHPLLSFVVAGGGFSGVETTAGINDFLQQALSLYPHLSPADLRVTLVHSGAELLPELGGSLGAYARSILTRDGIEVRTGTKVAHVDGTHVELSDGTKLEAATVVWTAGTAPNPLVERLPVVLERGRIRVAETLEVPGRANVFAVGDCAAIPNGAEGGFHPPTAQHASREARVAAENVLARLAGEEPRRRFRYRAIGQLAAIGRRSGVAQIFGFQFSGFFAWWLWRTIYLAKLPRAEKKLRVMIDWTLDLVFSKDVVQYLGARDPIGARAHDPRGR